MNKNPNENMPKDRSSIITEQRNIHTMNLHKLSVGECVEIINKENQEIFLTMDKAKDSLTSFIEAAEERFNSGGRLIYIGAGTSGRLGVLDAAEAPPTFHVDTDRIISLIAGGDNALRRSSEGEEDDPSGAYQDIDILCLKKDDIILGITAGGTTPYVLGALAYARQCRSEILIGMLTSTPIPHPPPCIDHLIVLETGPEVLTGSTRLKAGTATKIALNTISTVLMIRSGHVYENLMIDVRPTNDKLRDRASRIVSTLTGLSRNESFDLLIRAGGVVKIAVIMQCCGLSRTEAEELLYSHNGRIDRIMERCGKNME